MEGGGDALCYTLVAVKPLSPGGKEHGLWSQTVLGLNSVSVTELISLG